MLAHTFFGDVDKRKPGKSDGIYATWPGYEGRQSNGPLWPEYLRQWIGTKGQNATSLTYGQAGAHVTKTVTATDQAAKPDAPRDAVEQIQEYVGAGESAEHPFKVATNIAYVLWIGLNPLRELYERANAAGFDDGSNKMNETLVGAINQMMAKLGDALRTLDKGVTNYGITLMTIPPLGTLPAIAKGTEASKVFYANDLTKWYNDAMQKVADGMNGSGRRVVSVYNVAPYWEQYILKPADYGLDGAIADVLKPGRSPPASVDDIRKVLLVDQPNTAKATSFLFYDDFHMTSRFHEDLARRLAAWLGGNSS